MAEGKIKFEKTVKDNSDNLKLFKIRLVNNSQIINAVNNSHDLYVNYLLTLFCIRFII
jgi:hypothetical protein